MEHTDRFIIEDGVLKEYRGDERIAVPEGVREIGERAFAWDRGVVSVTLPEESPFTPVTAAAPAQPPTRLQASASATVFMPRPCFFTFLALGAEGCPA